MSANTQFARDFIDRSWNKRDESAIDDYISQNHIAQGPMTDEFQGLDGQKRFLHTFLTAFGQLHAEIKNIQEKGEWVNCQILFTGKNTGPFMGRPATNKNVKVPVNVSYRIHDGSITESKADWDPNAMMTQLYGEHVS